MPMIFIYKHITLREFKIKKLKWNSSFFYNFVENISNMEIVEYNKAPKVPIEFEAKSLCRRNDMEVIHLIIGEAKVLDRHINPTDIVFYVLSGKGILEVAENRYVLSEKTCVQIEANAELGWINSGKGDLVLLVIKTK
jgi:quercetin dioxygenase-like cupin family protein